MDTIAQLKKELQQEYETTKKFIDRFPDDKTEYAPHEKSMKMLPLAIHIVEILGWPDFMLKTEKLDFADNTYQPSVINNRAELLQKLEEGYEASMNALAHITEDDLNHRWTMNMGDKLLADYDKYEAMRVALNQLTHHRAQLGVYYRLNNIPLPGSYGPTADEQNF
jgi:uncharacterized damage-inducible protein DinB